jgi:hypothetical protein
MKRTNILLGALLIFLISGIKGQDYNFLGLCVGGALPQGNFSENNFSDSTNGYANNGFMFSFDAAWFPDDYMGIGATVTFASNNPDEQKYMDDLKNSFIINYPEPDNFPLDSINLDYGVWKYLNFFIGPNFTYPLGKFNFDLRAMAGLSLVWKPTQSILINYPETNTFSRKVEDKPFPALGYSIGGGIRYAFKSGYVIRFIAEYANTKPTFEIIDEIIWNPEEETFTTIEKEIAIPIKNIHLGIGIAYNFEL